MKIYHYSKDSYEFIRESEARKDPIKSEKQEKDIYLVPAYATKIQPPSVSENEIAIFNETEKIWKTEVDYRGEIFYKKDSAEEVKIEEIGEVNSELTNKVPPKKSDPRETLSFNVDINDWEIIPPPIEDIRRGRIKEGKNNTRKVILSRFRDDHQLNLYDGTKDDIPDMWNDTRVSDYQIVIDFKKEAINATHFYEQQLINATTLEEVESIPNDPQTIIDRAYENTANEDYNINWENVKENL